MKIRRLLAYIIDIIIISFLVSTICSVLPKKDLSSQKELKTLEIKMINKQITPKEYIVAYKDILYENHKNNNIEITINLLLIIGYFVVFQYTNNGRTLGKMLLKIKVVNKDTNKSPSLLKGLLRSIIIFNILSGLLSTLLIIFINENTYVEVYLWIIEIENILAIICLLLMIFRKDNRGLHDLIFNTEVIEER